MPKTPAELREGLKEAGLPNIFIPSEDSFLRVPEIPVLGSGKLDLKGLKVMAEEHFRTLKKEGKGSKSARLTGKRFRHDKCKSKAHQRSTCRTSERHLSQECSRR